MATFTHEWITEDVMLVTLFSDFRLGQDLPPSNQESIRQLDGHDGPAWAIIDMSQVHASLDEVIRAANEGTRTDNQMMKHPKLRGTVFLTTNDLFKLAAKGLRAPIFGVNAYTAANVEEALELIKQQQ